MKDYLVLIICIFLGGLSWAICPIVSDRFEPFDTEPGFYLGQFIMSIFLVYVGWVKNIKSILIGVSGLYIGQIAYAYIFCGGETRAWFMLGLVTIIALCVSPLILGLLSRLVSTLYVRFYANT